MHNMFGRVLAGAVILSCVAGVPLRADEARSRAIVLAPRPFVLVVLVRGIEDGTRSSALIAQIARVLFDEAQAVSTPPGCQGP